MLKIWAEKTARSDSERLKIDEKQTNHAQLSNYTHRAPTWQCLKFVPENHQIRFENHPLILTFKFYPRKPGDHFEKPPPSFILPPTTYLDLLNRLRVRNRPGLCIIFKRWRADKRCRKQFSPAFCFNIINLNLSGYKQLQPLIDSEVNMWITCSEKE